MKKPEIYCFGDINQDVFLNIPHYPKAGGDAIASKIYYQLGGSSTNTAIVLAKFRLQVGLIGCIGEDYWGGLALEIINEMGIDTKHIFRVPNISTGLIFIPVETRGERTMFSYRGANTRFQPDDITTELFDSVKTLHLSAYNFLEPPQRESSIRAIDKFYDQGGDIVLDVGVAPLTYCKSTLLEISSKISTLVLGEHEANELMGVQSLNDAVKLILDLGVGCVAIKLGKDGCLVANKEIQYRVPGFNVEVRDTTGAGDSFCAGMIIASRTGMSLSAAGILANALGALATSVWGAGTNLPGHSEMVALLNSQKEYRNRLADISAFDEILTKIKQ